MSKRVTIYTWNQCPYCQSAKALLKQNNIPFEEVHLDRNNAKEWDDLCTKSGMKTVPQIFLDNQLIGGFQELSNLNQKDGLKSLRPTGG